MKHSILTILPTLIAVSIPLFSRANALPGQSKKPINGDKWAADGERCGPDFKATCSGLCCSGAGYCGKSEEFCSVPGNCQEGWGWCDSYITPKGPDVSHGHRKYEKELPTKVDKCSVPKTLALSFDDGPSEYTHTVLDLLKEHGARATFFLGGVINGRGQLDDDAWSTIILRMIAEGHQIGSHTWSHPDLDKLSSADRKMQMYKTERAIANVIGKMPTFMRPPMIICGEACMKDMKDLGYHVVGWEVDSEDWHDPQPPIEETAVRLVEEMYSRDNMFLIQHDTSETAIAVLQSLLENKPADWKAVPLVECLGHDLEDAFQYPEWLEHKGATCLVSGAHTCLPAVPFETKRGCNDAVQIQQAFVKECFHPTNSVSGMKPVEAICNRMKKITEMTGKFCKHCKENKDCNSDRLTYKV